MRLMPGDPRLADVLALIRAEFAYMDGRIDPPSSMRRLTLDDLSTGGEVWVIGDPILACVVLTIKSGALYVGKLAVAGTARRQGLARVLIAVAEDRAVALGLAKLELQVRVELVSNQNTFAALGFVETARTAHPGYDRPTSITMERRVKRPLSGSDPSPVGAL
jgi:ribosomal protein S18 acetylase RimI-like enzyme